MNPGPIPREKIAWYPTIDATACAGEQECVRFCPHQVFQWDEDAGRPVVVQPYNCVVGCSACMDICPGHAISFPDPEALVERLRQLRAEAAAGASRIS